MRRMPQHSSRERGAALITVLFITVVMATLSVALVEDVSSGISRAAGRSQTNQARWFALGSEKLAIAALNATARLNPNRHTLNDPWATEGGRFELVGGFIDSELYDAGNCFNVNGLVQETQSGLEANEAQIAQFKLLLTALEIDPIAHDLIVDGLVDWIDSDSQPRGQGSEDYDYLSLAIPYRTPNDLMQDIAELRALRGMTDILLGLLDQFVCALPVAAPSVFNVNTMTPDQAPLLVMLTEARMDRDTAADVIRSRPETGYNDIGNFTSLPQFQNAGLASGTEKQLAIKTRYFELYSNVAFGDSFVQLVSMFDTQASGGIYRISRRFGEI